MDCSQLGANLRYCRERLKYTQEEIGNYLGISQPAYNKYERGETSVSIIQLEKLAALYGIEENDLLHSTPDRLRLPLSFAFRKNGAVGNLEAVAGFKRIIKNYIFLCDELSQD